MEDKNVMKKICEKAEEKLGTLLEQGINSNNLDAMDKLVDIIKDTKKIEMMKEGGNGMYREGNYGEYGRRGGYREDGYSEGNYNEYGRRGVKGTGRGRRRYRGDDMLEDMYGAYGEYEEGREEYERGNYGADSKKSESLKYMLESVVEFFKMLKKDASSQEDMEMIKHYAKKISEM